MVDRKGTAISLRALLSSDIVATDHKTSSLMLRKSWMMMMMTISISSHKSTLANVSEVPRLGPSYHGHYVA